MCSLILSFLPGDAWPVVIGANRDEMLTRPWDPPAAHWPDRPGVVAGRDRTAGGTWLGLNRHGVVAALLNRTGSLGPAPDKASRGALPLMALEERSAAAAAARLARLDAGRYRSFNLLVADAAGGFVLRGLEQGAPEAMRLDPGITMITAHDPNDPDSPRIARYRGAFEAAPRPDPAADAWTAWRALLADRAPPADTALNVGPRGGFGTVSSALIGLGGERARFLFAPGPPDQAAFAPVI
jgi:uncharacterized protein with NRDE domain